MTTSSSSSSGLGWGLSRPPVVPVVGVYVSLPSVPCVLSLSRVQGERTVRCSRADVRV